ncbi:SCP2 sterol-binding domain-containing protein [Streptomyces sp. WMMC500]|uniref:SCP2 sterol-binding domain-containing protein n=1 Tax=Streptomyces sp. WMMC500 TaxID=3015154 RepID=UPI00248B234D|nr:SCP2 sterol-binding domain-containing protein [Streptomyces sp. WMMC500]WBB58758.1 SCP2 sterol-binding domain-containing protein [Streptomyces sp. WMMC500]
MTDDTPGLEGLDLAAVSPDEYARIIRGLSSREIEELGRDEALRGRVVGEVFGRMEQQFQPERAGDLDAVIRWQIAGVTEVVYDVTVSGGACAVREGRGDRRPRVTLEMGDEEFLKVTSGNAGPVKLFMTRKLKVTGDVALALKLTGMFDIPKAG